MSWFWPFGRSDEEREYDTAALVIESDPIVDIMIRIRRRDNACIERTARCRRSQIEHYKDEALDEIDMREVWVYEQVYHHRRINAEDAQPQWIAGLTGPPAAMPAY